MDNVIRSLEQMQSGQCQWIGREDVHVYRHSPLGRVPRFCVVCPDAGLDYLPYENWVTATEAAALIRTIV